MAPNLPDLAFFNRTEMHSMQSNAFTMLTGKVERDFNIPAAKHEDDIVYSNSLRAISQGKRTMDTELWKGATVDILEKLTSIPAIVKWFDHDSFSYVKSTFNKRVAEIRGIIRRTRK
ncbi:hypothetical protein KIN20_005907 [Parelaphostrongylus tenuis]|uniref:Uncharacterized protein n=1 Tax=Parelaphostrongylus tenuis TaxID=148309 RepID=A0AAD5M587_PARTN|nr:hypothetical protein KIN20_005907 [Parelaphostrongylus tenuis]